MTFLLNSNRPMFTLTKTISTQNTTQANYDLINEPYLRASLALLCRKARKYGLFGQSLLEWCFEYLLR